MEKVNPISEHPKCFAELLLNTRAPICNPNSQNIKRRGKSVKRGRQRKSEAEQLTNPNHQIKDKPVSFIVAVVTAEG
jgi:hypothetical protein